MWHAIRAARGETHAIGRSETDSLVHVGRQLARWAARVHPERSNRGIAL
jgi:hypothetical protein